MPADAGVVLTILLVNAGVPLADYAKVFYRTGFDVISYVPPASMGGSSDQRGCMGIVDWPSVEDMVASGKRAVVFLSAGADEGSVPYLLPEFDYMFEVGVPFLVTITGEIGGRSEEGGVRG